MAFIQTVNGKISPEEMGVTYCHDHILFMPPPPFSEKDPTLRLDDIDKSLKEIAFFKQAGGGCVIEMSTVETGRSPEGLLRISLETGVHIVATTGFNKSIYCEAVVTDQTVEEIASNMIVDLKVGMDGKNIKAGVIKASSSKDKFTPGETKIFNAAVLAHQDTGATISTHTEAGTMALEQIEILVSAGVKPESIVIGHLDRRLDWNFISQIALTGVFMSFDQLSKEKYFPDSLRIEFIKKLISAGHEDQLMLSGDLARLSYLPSYGFGYGPGFTYILWRFIPWMLEEGVSREVVDKIMVQNPAKSFTWK